MVTRRGKGATMAFMSALPDQIEQVLRGAGRAGAGVIAEEIKSRTPSDEVRENLRIRTRASDGQIVVRIDVKPGWARSVGIWLEWGTSGHFITVDDAQRGGRSVGRINAQVKEAGGDASLVIGGKFVGRTVWHPGARPHPAFRPALDTKGSEAIATAQSYINARVTRQGVKAPAEPEGAEA